MARFSKRKSDRAEKRLAQKRAKRVLAPLESTQSDIPVREIFNGIVLTTDGRYVKILEIKPSSFLLKTPAEQYNIIYGFDGLLRIGPNSLQITSIAIQPDISKQLKDLDEIINQETNTACLEMDKEYRDKLVTSSKQSISHRFFISFAYENLQTNAFTRPSLETIVSNLERTAANITDILEHECGNIVVPFDAKDPNSQTAEILYTILNRSKYVEEPFAQHRDKIIERYYLKEGGSDSFYIPPTDLIAPDKLVMNDSRYMMVNDLYYSYCYIPSNGYNDTVFAGWLQPFVNSFEGVDVNVYMNKVDYRAISSRLSRNLDFSIATFSDAKNSSESFYQSNAAINAGQYLQAGLQNKSEFFYISILITVCGRTPQEVEMKKDELKKTASMNNCKLYDCTYEQEKAFLSSLPLGMLAPSIQAKAKRNCLDIGAASTYPFIASEIMDEQGIYMGDNTASGSMLILDIFNQRRFPNANMFIVGMSGAGKSFTLKLIALRMRIMREEVFAIIPEKEDEFRRVAAGVGGQFIQIAPGSPDRINVMDIYSQDSSAMDAINGSHLRQSYLAEKVTFLKTFFAFVIDEMSAQTEQLLDEALIVTYGKKGITEDNDSIYDLSDPDHKKLKEMPIISDLRDTLISMSETDTSGECQRMANILRIFTDGSLKSFNGQTNVNLNTMFTAFGTERMEKKYLPLAIHLCMDYCWSRIREDSTMKKGLFIDEFWRLAFNPEAIEYVLTIVKTCRYYSTSLVLSTQQLSDVMANPEFGKGILGNCAIKILMKMAPEDAAIVSELIKINGVDINELIHFSPGNALMVAGADRERIYFEASESEKYLVATDAETMNVIKKAKEMQRLRNQSLELIDDEPDEEQPAPHESQAGTNKPAEKSEISWELVDDEDQTDQHSNHQDSDITWELVDDDEDEDGKEGNDHGR